MSCTQFCLQHSEHENTPRKPARTQAVSDVEGRLNGSRKKTQLFSAGMVFASLLGAQAQAETAPTKFVPFSEFVQSVKGVDSSEFLAHPSAARVKVSDAAAVDEMRQHILKIYGGVNVSHSYVVSGQTVDCVPVSEQPSVRGQGMKSLASEPPSSAAKSPGNHAVRALKLSHFAANSTTDQFGNALGCEANTIPMARTTLEQLSHFKNLHEFFQKGPNGSGHLPAPSKFSPPSPYDHKYSFAYQNVNALGDTTTINLWRNPIWTDIGEIFSLAQSWTIGLSSGPVQTAEVGMQVFPDRTGSPSPTPFIYYTADGYQNTGCYDLTCSAFVQVNNSITFGVPFDPSSYSVFDGNQTDIQLEYYMWQGNWWLMVNGTWIGYYPGSLYNGGQLAYYANQLEFGSESVGDTVWPGEGSGLFAENGFSYSAYQRNLYYFDTSYNAYWDSLTSVAPSPSCYSISQPGYQDGGYWGVFFYFGGPGGASCE